MNKKQRKKWLLELRFLHTQSDIKNKAGHNETAVQKLAWFRLQAAASHIAEVWHFCNISSVMWFNYIADCSFLNALHIELRTATPTILLVFVQLLQQIIIYNDDKNKKAPTM